MVMSDWLQGPYVYALYSEYGFSKGDIGLLFIAGFGSSLLFGTVVGGFADRYGRKLNCLLFALLYGLSCITKHFNDFNILMIGRLLGGVATSILMSAFETWMIHEHRTVSHAWGSTFSPSSHAWGSTAASSQSVPIDASVHLPICPSATPPSPLPIPCSAASPMSGCPPPSPP